MHRIIRTALASMGAAAVVAGGSLGVAYATAPASDPAQSASSGDSDQVAALNKQADDLLAKIGTLEKQLTSAPATTPSPSTLTKQEIAVTTDQATSPASQAARTTAQAPAKAAAPAAPTSQRDDDDSNKGDSDD
jgi:hypothetical protein